MAFKEIFKTALVKVLSDLILTDGIVNQGETDYLNHIYDLLNITSSQAKKSESLSLSQAVVILNKLDKIEKFALLTMIQQLSMADDNLDSQESMLITAIALSINLESTQTTLTHAEIVSIPSLPLNTNNTVLYIEPSFDETINSSILNDYDKIHSLLKRNNFDFFYLPKVLDQINQQGTTLKDVIQYIEPSLSSEKTDAIMTHLVSLDTAFFSKEMFLNYLNLNGFSLKKPSFFFKLENKHSGTYSDFLILEITDYTTPYELLKWFFNLDKNVLTIIPNDLSEKEHFYLQKFVLEKDNSHIKNEILYTGFHKMIIDTILRYNDNSKLSRLFINSSGRIFLIDKNNIEIKLPALCRALYILFLLHDEGIRLYELSDHKKELLTIYKQVSTYHDEEKLSSAIDTVVDFVGLTLNSNLSRIKKAFTSILGNNASFYLIQGSKGDIKKINLDRNLLSFEDKSVFTNL